jgi:hypothetical protein
MDRLYIYTRDNGFLYRVRYNGWERIVPYFRVESAIRQLVREYHAAQGRGR